MRTFLNKQQKNTPYPPWEAIVFIHIVIYFPLKRNGLIRTLRKDASKASDMQSVQ